MKTDTQEHWSGPNGCDDKCPACAVERAARHTPGPWHTHSEQHREWIIGSDGLPVGYTLAECRFQRDNVANAALIAAAPDLLTVCKQFVTTADALVIGGVALPLSLVDCYQSARSAIALATGGAK